MGRFSTNDLTQPYFINQFKLQHTNHTPTYRMGDHSIIRIRLGGYVQTLMVHWIKWYTIVFSASQLWSSIKDVLNEYFFSKLCSRVVAHTASLHRLWRHREMEKYLTHNITHHPPPTHTPQLKHRHSRAEEQLLPSLRNFVSPGMPDEPGITGS